MELKVLQGAFRTLLQLFNQFDKQILKGQSDVKDALSAIWLKKNKLPEHFHVKF